SDGHVPVCGRGRSWANKSAVLPGQNRNANAAKAPPLQLLQKFEKPRLRQFLLLASRERFQRPFAARHFIIAEDEGVTSAQFVSLAEGLAEFLLDRRQFDTEARGT